MDKSVYIRRLHLYKEWSKLKLALMNEELTFENWCELREKEEDTYNRWFFYDKLLKRLEVLNHGNKKKKCNKEKNCTYKRKYKKDYL
jgi:hypothetical protein